ncbi:MAG: biotin--[acetyl-CoA-carboxylase] ligase [Candidatus Heimdallarchaeota archaeon]
MSENLSITVIDFDEVTSTQDVARKYIKDGKYCHGLVFKANKQAEGRGRLERFWDSQEGGLWVSLVIQKELPLELFHGFSVRLGLHIIQELEQIIPLDFKIKWPNDIILLSKKVGGILIELSSSGESLSHMICGVGINVNNSYNDLPKSFRKNATTLRKEIDSELLNLEDEANKELLVSVNLATVEKAVITSFYHLLKDLETHQQLVDLPSIWNNYSETINQQIKLETANETIVGIERGITPSGELLLEKTDGTIIEIQTGDVYLVRKTNISQ